MFWKLSPCESYHSQIFSVTPWLSFLFMFFFAVQELVSLIRSSLFIFAFIYVRA